MMLQAFADEAALRSTSKHQQQSSDMRRTKKWINTNMTERQPNTRSCRKIRICLLDDFSSRRDFLLAPFFSQEDDEKNWVKEAKL